MAWSHFSDYTRPVKVLNKYAIGVWSDNLTAAFFVGFIVTVFVPDIDGNSE